MADLIVGHAAALGMQDLAEQRASCTPPPPGRGRGRLAQAAGVLRRLSWAAVQRTALARAAQPWRRSSATDPWR